MNNKKVIEYISKQEPDFLQPARKKDNKGHITYICPLCGNGSGATGDGITRNYKVKDKVAYTCFRCDKKGDTLDWWLYYNNLSNTGNDFIKGLVEYCKKYNLTEFLQEPEPEIKHIPLKAKTQETKKELVSDADSTTKYKIENIQDISLNADALAYIQGRGISAETCNNCNVKVGTINTGGYSHKEIVKENLSKGYTYRNIDSNDKYFVKGNIGVSDISILCNNDTVYKNDNCVFITEGLFDALAISELGLKSISLNSLNNLNKLYNYLNDNKQELRYKPIIISLDNDSAGKDAIPIYKDKLFDLGLDIRFIDICAGTDYKDINAFIVADKDKLNATLYKLVQDILIDLRDNNQDTFLYWWNNRKQQEQALRLKRFDTGISSLDSILGGGLPVGLTVLGGVSSLGKTTLLSQIGEHLSSKGITVLFFSLEQAPYDIFSKGLKRNLFFNGKDRTYNSFNVENVTDYYNKVKYNFNVISGDFNTTIKTIKQKILSIKAYSDNDIVVIVDYLQALTPTDKLGNVITNYSDKQKTDNLIQDLKLLSNNYNIPVLTISSIARDKYYTKIELDSFKETGNIEYTADIILGLDLTKIRHNNLGTTDTDKKQGKNILDAEYQKDLRLVSITTLKNRNGKSRLTADIIFNTAWQVFTELNSDTDNIDWGEP